MRCAAPTTVRQTQQQIDRGRASQAAQRHNAPQRNPTHALQAVLPANNAPQRQANVSRPAGGAAAQRRNQ
jgi:hypothetical protein